MKLLTLIICLLLIACGDRTVSFSEPAPHPFRNWTCHFAGLGPSFELTLPLVGLQYDVEATFDENICDLSGPTPVCMLQPVQGTFHADGTVSTVIPTVGTVVYVITKTSLTLIDPSGQPGYGDLECLESL